MNIEITDWDINEVDERLYIYYETEGSVDCEMFKGDNLYNALVEVGVFESYDGFCFTHHMEVVSHLDSVHLMHEVETPNYMLWRHFDHFIDTRIMKQLVELKIKK